MADLCYWLLWDAGGEAHDSANVIRAMAYQDAPRPPMTDDLARRCRQAVHVIAPAGQTLAERACVCWG